MENKRPKRINISVGVSDDINTEVISKDLKGDEVVLIGILNSKKSNKNRGPRPRMF